MYMIKKYIHIVLFMLAFSFSAIAQEVKPQQTDGLGFYPNPVENGKIYITSKSSLDKEIIIFDVLGKKVMQTTINTRELSVSSIPPGVYIIKIREGENATTRKLIIK